VSDIHVASASFDDVHVTAKGVIEGHGAVYGNIDSHGDLIERGAFVEGLAERKRQGRSLPSMYAMHGAAMGGDPRPIGVWTEMREDSRGLFVRGKLVGVEDTQQGKYNYALVKEGALRGLSIGYRVPPGGSRTGSGRAGEPARYIKKAILREVSLVDDPSNAYARIESIKARWAGEPIVTADTSKPRTVSGLATRYLKPFIKDGRFYAFMPGCFAKSLCDGRTLRLIYNHDETRLVACSGGGGMSVKDTADGLAFQAKLQRNPDGDLILDQLDESGSMGCSLGFKITRSEDIPVDGGEKVTVIYEADLSELTICREGAVSSAFCLPIDSLKSSALLYEKSAVGVTNALKKFSSTLQTAFTR
jgi:HK97 family phage prohead protease